MNRYKIILFAVAHTHVYTCMHMHIYILVFRSLYIYIKRLVSCEDQNINDQIASKVGFTIQVIHHLIYIKKRIRKK